MHIHTPPRDSQAGPEDRFVGRAWLRQIAVPEDPERTRVVEVRFEPGARTAWHRHPRGQVLYILSGTGLVQRRGGPVQEVSAGDVIVTPPDEEHWHGAAPDSSMTHRAIQQAD